MHILTSFCLSIYLLFLLLLLLLPVKQEHLGKNHGLSTWYNRSIRDRSSSLKHLYLVKIKQILDNTSLIQVFLDRFSKWWPKEWVKIGAFSHSLNLISLIKNIFCQCSFSVFFNKRIIKYIFYQIWDETI